MHLRLYMRVLIVCICHKKILLIFPTIVQQSKLFYITTLPPSCTLSFKMRLSVLIVPVIAACYGFAAVIPQDNGPEHFALGSSSISLVRHYPI